MGTAIPLPSQNGGASISSTLLFGIQNRDSGAWERFFRIWAPVVYCRIRERGISTHDAEDLVQIIFQKISQGISQFQRGSFRAWLHQIMGNCIADFFRNKPRVPIVQGGTTSWLPSIPAPDSPQPSLGDSNTASISAPPGEWDPLEFLHPPQDSEAELTEKQLLLRQILEEIRREVAPQTFQAFWRTTVDGLSSAEVGRELGMSAEAVRAARYRILRRLRQELQALEGDLNSSSSGVE